MHSSKVPDATASPGRTSAHNRLRANSTTGPLLPALASACGCAMLAEANTSARAPPAISSLSVPEGPNFGCTFGPPAASNAPATSVSALRRLPAACSSTGSAAIAAVLIAAAGTKRQGARPSRPRHGGVGEEQLLAVDLVVGDRLLPFGRHQPVDEGLAQLRLYMRMLGGIDQNDAVLVEQAVVAFHHDGEVAAVPERQPSAAVREHIGVGCGGGVERRAH